MTFLEALVERVSVLPSSFVLLSLVSIIIIYLFTSFGLSVALK